MAIPPGSEIAGGSEAPLPLVGVHVVDLTHALSGPYCTLLLADLGADVIKVEPPIVGDQSRVWGPPFIQGESSYFLSVNRNKRSVSLDLKTEAGLRAATALAQVSDVVVENFKPGTAAQFGLDATTLRASRPELIHASISGFGQNRPTLAGYDQIAQGTSGLMSVTGAADGPPTKVGVPVGDITAGMFAAHAVLAALVERHRTGIGRTIDVALNDSLLALLTYQAGRLFAVGNPPPTRTGNGHATIVPYGTFEASDGYVNLAVGSDAQFRRFCEALGAPELAADARFETNAQRQVARQELIPEIQERMRRRPRGEWLEQFEAHGIPAGPIFNIAEAFSSPLATDRAMRLEIDHPTAGRIAQVGAPWKLDGRSIPIRTPPPTLGEHTTEVLREMLGYDDAMIALATTPAPGDRSAEAGHQPGEIS
ncbi:MAG: CaiB/BaiF CoA transferase family protein [Candidatus Dormibacteria bacterium]